MKALYSFITALALFLYLPCSFAETVEPPQEEQDDTTIQNVIPARPYSNNANRSPRPNNSNMGRSSNNMRPNVSRLSNNHIPNEILDTGESFREFALSVGAKPGVVKLLN